VNFMRKKWNAFISALGFEQTWHVCWVAMIEGKNITYGDGTFAFSPRLESSDIGDLREKLAKEVSDVLGYELSPKKINITGLIRIGK